MQASERTQATDTPSLSLEAWEYPEVDWEQLQANWEAIDPIIPVIPKWYDPFALDNENEKHLDYIDIYYSMCNTYLCATGKSSIPVVVDKFLREIAHNITDITIGTGTGPDPEPDGYPWIPRALQEIDQNQPCPHCGVSVPVDQDTDACSARKDNSQSQSMQPRPRFGWWG